MSLYYYKSDVGNIGDDLNQWLWPDIFDFDKIDPEVILIGFGSILTDQLPELGSPKKICDYKRKIVLGAGVRSISTLPEVDQSWDLSFLRGPISSLFLTGTLDNYISDGAYALRQHSRFSEILNTEKKYKVSYMPYLRTSHLIPWRQLCQELGVHYISPHEHDNIEETLAEISASEVLITEAMHGAILADILRVPWKKVQFGADVFEGGAVNETKWNDWARSVGVSFKTHRLASFPNKYTIHPRIFRNYAKFNRRNLTRTVRQNLSAVVDDNCYHLSSPETIELLDQKIVSQLEVIKSVIYSNS